MITTETLLKLEDCTVLLVGFQAGLGFGVESIGRQALLNNAVALAKTATAFGVPVVASTSASRVYSGPLFSGIAGRIARTQTDQARSMNVWEDDAARGAIVANRSEAADCSRAAR
jgi:hypothetical protein